MGEIAIWIHSLSSPSRQVAGNTIKEGPTCKGTWTPALQTTHRPARGRHDPPRYLRAVRRTRGPAACLRLAFLEGRRCGRWRGVRRSGGGGGV